MAAKEAMERALMAMREAELQSVEKYIAACLEGTGLKIDEVVLVSQLVRDAESFGYKQRFWLEKK